MYTGIYQIVRVSGRFTAWVPQWALRDAEGRFVLTEPTHHILTFDTLRDIDRWGTEHPDAILWGWPLPIIVQGGDL